MSAGTLHTLPLEKTFEIARETGFDGIEIIINHDFRFADNAGLVRDLQQILPVMSLHAPFFQIDGWGDKIRQLQKTVELARATGVLLVNFHPPCWLGMELKFWRWLVQIRDFQAEVGGNEVVVTIENMPRLAAVKLNPYILSQTRQMIDFIRARNLFLTFDTAHMGTTHTNFLNDFHRFYDSTRMRNIHFSDYGYGREHLLPGRGVLPLTRFLNHLSETGYDEAITLELSPYEFPEDETGIRAGLAEVYTYLWQETRAEKQPAVG